MHGSRSSKAALLAVAASTITTLVCASFASLANAQESRGACNPCIVGQTLSFHGTAYRVNKARLASRIGDSFLGGKARGVFVIVSLTMTDLKSRPSTILASAIQIKSHGATFDISDQAFGVYKNGLTIVENLNPHLPVTDIAVYDIPKTYVHGAQLQIEDLGSGSHAYIRLGL